MGDLLSNIVQRRNRPHLGDLLRALAYGHIAIWSALYLFHPSLQVAQTTADYTRLIWVGMSGLGALVAMIGSLSGLDVKMELPGILFAAIGPAFYSLINIYFFIIPPDVPGPPTDPYTRLALSALFVSISILILPRALELYSEALRTRNLNLLNQSTRNSD